MNNPPCLPGEPRPMRFASRPATRIAATLAWATLGVGLILAPLGDFLSVHAANSGTGARISLLVRGATIAGLLAAILWRGRVPLSGVRLTIAAAVVACSTLGACALGALTKREAVEQLVFATKVFSFFIYPAAMALLGDRRLAQIASLAHASLLVYGASIVGGALLSIEMFRSYQADTHIRSGYKGIVFAQNEAAALVVVALGFGYLNALLRGWTPRNTILVGCMLAAAMLTGTKGAMAGALGVTFAYLYARHRALKATGYACVVAAALAATALFAYLTIPDVAQAVDLSLRYFSHQSGRLGGDRLFTLLLSGRDLKFARVWDDLQQHGFVALLTGGHPVTRYMVEIDIPDLILMFGLPVFVVYGIALARAFVYRGPRTRARRFGLLFFLVLIAMASTAGHVLGSAVVGPYLALIAVMIRRNGIRPHLT
ncbi:hypothetical protein C5O80_18330 [Burkholderia sp. SRS-46]|nr:hypothetical protein C5O80_18330 [Burkholderia sp. SRS-46]